VPPARAAAPAPWSFFLEQQPAAEGADAHRVRQRVQLAVGQASEGAVVEVEPRERPRQVRRRVPRRDAEPVAADGGEAQPVGKGRQAA